jgi:hypothetical protein
VLEIGWKSRVAGGMLGLGHRGATSPELPVIAKKFQMHPSGCPELTSN